MADAWEYAGEEWKGSTREIDSPEFRRWFEARVRGIARGWGWRETRLYGLVEFAELKMERYCVWTPNEKFLGHGYSNGHWVVDVATLRREYVELATRTSLDYWLHADLKNFLPPQAVPAEPGGHEVLRAAGLSATRFWEHRNRVHHRWPVNCRKCGETFRTTNNGQEECRPCRGLPPLKATHAPRVYKPRTCAGCAGEFIPTSPRAAKCTSCNPPKKSGRSTDTRG